MERAVGMTTQLTALLMQLPVPNNPSLNTPLAAGYLKSYAEAQGITAHVAIDLLPRRLADHAGDAQIVDAVVARQPDILGISLYTWNSERSLQIAERIKQRLPHLRVVVGGPEVQRDNEWVLMHPAVDVAVLGEGEQTFAELLRFWAGVDADEPAEQAAPHSIPLLDATAPRGPLAHIAGLAYRYDGALQFTPERVALPNLMVLPSPYLSGYLEVPSDGMLMVEVSRWCPYSCSFCLYGRNMGSKLGNRYFDLERVLAEIRWGREQGIRRVHFVEANLNLVPLFWPLMQALADLNHDHAMTFYAELRGEHLTDAVVEALDRANVRYVEVGLQTANPTALKASLRRTDLSKWAAGTRRLYQHQIEVYLDVILGLPADDADGVQETLDFLQREQLGSYDVFTLQVLPGTAVRQQAEQYGLRFQERPPYYVLGTDRLSYAELRRLRRELKRGAGLDPDAIEGMPEPRPQALTPQSNAAHGSIAQLWLHGNPTPSAEVQRQLAAHVDVVLRSDEVQIHSAWLAEAIAANPSTVFDIYLDAATHEPSPAELRAWRSALPFQPGYLDRVAVYQAETPEPEFVPATLRIFVVLPWTSTAEPDAYADVAQLIWRFELCEGDVVPFGAWYAAEGAGIALRFAPECSEQYRSETLEACAEWQRETGRIVWLAV